ncbi:MAG TPA: ribonucleotide reductase subunit alpha [Aromatoleum sp.]|uniref:ribonucleotide reductase subunit alpha n=1 Tax=Aromatoleum sp. TaxID=2307007 RepID=UPI002B4733F7|nr:ribonucleotide reductase subunit alpha [Aromatoleum sp.]HJV27751.1 ribonucleotide reductase subunit alpha [Aromatoleum sp.]
MIISGFQNLLETARRQPEPQRLLFVFVRAELPEGASAEEKRIFENGQGGALVPVMYVDKKTNEIQSFAELVEESRHTGQSWDMVFVGCLSGQGRREPSDEATQQALETMVKSIQGGVVKHLLTYRPDGQQVTLP